VVADGRRAGHTTPASTGATSGCSRLSGVAIWFGCSQALGTLVLYSDADEGPGDDVGHRRIRRIKACSRFRRRVRR
jgi:hypothetical protein